MDDGRLTDGHGRTVDFKNTIIIMTSNVGMEAIKRHLTLGFAPGRGDERARQQSYDTMKDKVMESVRATFRPEFINRVDDIIFFHELTEPQLQKVIDLLARDLRQRLTEQAITVELTEAAKAWLVKEGYNPAYGARPLRRAIEQHVENPLANRLLAGEFKSGDTVTVDMKDNALTFNVTSGAAEPSGRDKAEG